MNKALSLQSTPARWLAFAVVVILCLVALIYTNPPIPGRAFKKNVVSTPTHQGSTDYKVTPDDLLW
jgi:hypothetical protein